MMHYLFKLALPVVTPNQLLFEADRCVKCGLCISDCPTYDLLINEADSPRGRISLMQALAKGELDLDSQVKTHLDRCLGCRLCESACPSGVRYGALLDASRETLNRYQGDRRWFRKILEQLSQPHRLNVWARRYHSLNRFGLVRLLRMLPITRIRHLLALAEQLKPQSQIKPGLYPAQQPTKRLVQLFVGCVSSHMEISLIKQAIELLNQLGYAVEIPREQSCCGALYRHNGFISEAEHLCETNRKQSSKSKAECMLTLASACHLELDEFQASKLPLQTLTEFLLALPSDEFPNLSTLHKRVAVHVPCSSRQDRSLELISRIPELNAFPLPENHLCCGAAGSYMLTQFDLSQRLGEVKIGHLINSHPELLLTSNTGCALQFRQLIEKAGLPIEVLHPIELIHRQYTQHLCHTTDQG
jgi:glycolate oxidase iron-sulfur subunit